jgi:hypothetical protein
LWLSYCVLVFCSIKAFGAILLSIKEPNQFGSYC